MITFNSISRILKLLITFLFFHVNFYANSQVVSTLSGNGIAGYINGAGINAEFNSPIGVAVDSSGNVYVPESNNNVIRKVAPSGVTTTLAGDGTAGYADGTGSSAQFNFPDLGITISAKNDIYVSDAFNYRIRKITQAGVVTTYAGNGSPGFGLNDGQGLPQEANAFRGIVFDKAGNLYIADDATSHIRKVTPLGAISTFAGNGIIGFTDGPGASAEFDGPAGLTIDTAGNVYVADQFNNCIRKITPQGVVTTFAGNGVPGFLNGNTTSAEFNQPGGITIDIAGNIFVSDNGNHCIRKITPGGLVTTFAGNGLAGYMDGNATDAEFRLNAVAVDKDGDVYAADQGNNRIRKVTSGTLPVTLIQFKAQLQKNKVILNWQTAKEQNTNSFAIQRSTDGRSFNTIGKVSAAGNSNSMKSYAYTDANITAIIARDLYYRLQEVDKDGKSNYSSIQVVPFTNENPLFSISPNPTKDFINIVSSKYVTDVQIKVIDMSGRILYTTKQTFTEGQQLKISLSQFPKEIFIVTIIDNNDHEHFKIIKE